MPEPPAELQSAAAEYWRQLAPMLVYAKILTPLHLETFRVLCETYGHYRALSDHLNELGPANWTFATETGYEQQIPQVAIQNQKLAALQRIWPKFGLTPLALAQLGKHQGARSGKLTDLEQFAADKYEPK